MSAEKIKNQAINYEERRAKEWEEFAIRQEELVKKYGELSEDSKYNEKERKKFREKYKETKNLAEEFRRTAEKHKQNADILK